VPTLSSLTHRTGIRPLLGAVLADRVAARAGGPGGAPLEP
jgi:hypothetical protein